MEFIQFTASDGVELHGLLQTATSESRSLAVDALIFLHGAASNFYSSSVVRGITPALLDAGVAVFSINTRGHDLAATLRTSAGGRRGGAAFELVDECRHDVQGAVDFLAARGFERIALAGHSLGALKAVYSQAFAARDLVKFVIAISPPRLSYATFSEGPLRDEFLEIISRAASLVAAGKPHELLDVTMPLPLLISAAGYLDKYGPGERYNILRFAANVPCEVLFTFGSQELVSGIAAFATVDADLRKLAATGAFPIDVEIVSGADHFYHGCAVRLAKALVAWPRWRVDAELTPHNH